MRVFSWITGLLLSISFGAVAQEPMSDIEKQVADRERAFARTMVDRDAAAFAEFVSTEGIFLSGPAPLRGRDAVAAGWAGFFEGENPPFSWEPETVLVLDSGNLALSTGPVYNPEGDKIAIFTTTWRQEEPGVWRVVFDRGNKACPAE